MTMVLDEDPEFAIIAGEERERYELGERVVWRSALGMTFVSEFRNERFVEARPVIGTVIAVFENGEVSLWRKNNLTYRLELDLLFTSLPQAAIGGEKLVVGNISGGELRPLILGPVT